MPELAISTEALYARAGYQSWGYVCLSWLSVLRLCMPELAISTEALYT